MVWGDVRVDSARKITVDSIVFISAASGLNKPCASGKLPGTSTTRVDMRFVPASYSGALSVLTIVMLAESLMLPSCVIAQTQETLYVSMLGTRKHRLSGVNPVVGLFLSTDGGVSWTHTGWEQGKVFAAVTPHGSAGDTIFVAAGNGVMRTTDGGQHWRIVTGWEVTEVQDVALSPGMATVFAATPYGIFRSQDFGDSWEKLDTQFHEPFVSSIRVDRSDPNVVLAGAEAGLYRSEDGGDTWEPTRLQQPIRSVRQHPHHRMKWAAALQDLGVAMSIDGGQTWRLSGDLEGKTVYEVEFDSYDDHRLLAGGWKTGLLESLDSGVSWARIDEGLPSEDIHGIGVSVATPGLVIVGTMDQGVFRSEDGGHTWAPADTTIFEAGQVWDVYVGGE